MSQTLLSAATAPPWTGQSRLILFFPTYGMLLSGSGPVAPQFTPISRALGATPTWFALSEDRPLAAFAGIWTTWHGKRGTKTNPVGGEHQLFGFLTTDANAEVGAVHPKAMPAILTTEAEIEQWMTTPAEEALRLQRPLPDGSLKIVATGEKEDPAVA